MFKKAFIQLLIGCYIKNCVGGHLGLSNNTENSNSNRLLVLQSHLKTFQQYHYEICPSRKHCLFHYYNIMFYCDIRASCATKLIFYTISQIYIKKGLRWLGPIGEWPFNLRGYVLFISVVQLYRNNICIMFSIQIKLKKTFLIKS